MCSRGCIPPHFVDHSIDTRVISLMTPRTGNASVEDEVSFGVIQHGLARDQTSESFRFRAVAVIQSHYIRNSCRLLPEIGAANFGRAGLRFAEDHERDHLSVQLSH